MNAESTQLFEFVGAVMKNVAGRITRIIVLQPYCSRNKERISDIISL